MRREEGFTLLEVLVALLVLAITMGALVKGGGINAANAGAMRDMTLANWVAMNQVAELQLQTAWPELGRQSGSETMAKREWYWQSEVEKTFDDDVRRVIVEVRSDKASETPIISRTAYLPRPNRGETR